jgi:hypothetical protein
VDIPLDNLTEDDLAVLSERERAVIELRYGLSKERPGRHSAVEVGALLGVRRARVYQVQRRAAALIGLQRSGQLLEDPHLIGPAVGSSNHWVRVCNALRRAGLDTWDQVAALPLSELTNIPNVGIKSIGAIVEYLEWLGLKHRFGESIEGHLGTAARDEEGK